MRNQRYDVPPLDPLLAFEAAARNLSFTKAAVELNLTQSAVSRQIQQLEEHLGLKLFQRRARALLLTENGQLFYRAAQDALQKLHDSARRLRGTTAANTVVVATTPGFASLWLIPHLAGFTRNHPHLDVRISATNEMIDDLERAGVDLAVRYVPEGSTASGRLLFGETVFPVCSPELASNRENPLVTPDDLHHHVLLYLEHPRAAWLDWELWFHALGLETSSRRASCISRITTSSFKPRSTAMAWPSVAIRFCAGCCASASSSHRSRRRSRRRAPTTWWNHRPRSRNRKCESSPTGSSRRLTPRRSLRRRARRREARYCCVRYSMRSSLPFSNVNSASN